MDHEDVFAYTRTFEGKTVIIVTNFRKTPVKWSLPQKITIQQDQVLVSNYDGVSVADETASLRPFEAFAAFVN